MSAASRTSVVVISKIAVSTSAPWAARAWSGASYESSSVLPMAAWKIDGLVVTPTTSRVSISCARLPVSIRDQYQYFTQADIGRMRGSGYAAPITPLAEAVGDYVKNYLVSGVHLGDV